MRQTPLKRTPFTAERKPLNKVGRVKKREIKETSKLRRAWLNEYPVCEIGQVLYAASKVHDDESAYYEAYTKCGQIATQVHERQKRTQGGSLVDPANCLRSCWHCNCVFIENEPKLAKEVGLTVEAHQNPSEIPVLGLTETPGRATVEM